jgi:hypothetical protein
MRPILLTGLLTCIVLLATAASPIAAERSLWATVNVCDTTAHPDEIGVRASMPGPASATGLYVRFRVQYQDPADARWHHVSGADSKWRRVGRGRGRPVESGWSFQLSGDKPQLLRGVARFQWRRGGHVVRRARRYTATGHRSTRGADPADFSAASCRIV